MKLTSTMAFLQRLLILVLLLIPLAGFAVTYYIDSNGGNDANDGLSDVTAWQSVARVQNTLLNPGDFVRFKRGSGYTVPFFVNFSGTSTAYITISDYGDAAAPAPAFTNPVFAQDNFGNCIRINGDYVIVEHLYFHNTAMYVDGNYYSSDGGWIVWEMGAINIARGSDYCIIRNNEFYDCVAGIRSRGKFANIQYNYIHDCNRPMKQWNWGPLGIWMGQDFQTCTGNTIVNMQVVDSDPSHFANGVGGGAFEIDDGRYNKYNIVLTDNFTRGNCGFLEAVFDDVTPAPLYKDWKIKFNVSDDYQAFVKLRFAQNCAVDNNTVLRRKINSNELGVFLLKGNGTANKFRNNIIMTKYNVEVFNVVGSYTPGSIIQNNHYYAVGTLVMGNEGPGASPTYGDAKFANITGTNAIDFSILATSPAKNTGLNLGYSYDFSGYPLYYGSAPDRGAFEYHP